MPVDYILRVDVEAFIHYNYDIFCEETLVKSVYEKENGLIYIYPAGMNRTINYVPIFQTIDFPVKRDMKLAGKVHDYYKLPRVMSKDIFLASVKCGRIDEYVK